VTAGSSVDWMAWAACRGAALELFISAGDGDDEEWEAPAQVKAVCEPCPVRAQCLDWALLFGDAGYWAGTSRHQRRQLKRARRRLACPVCGAEATVLVGSVQVCVGCAVSWPTRALTKT
jgi:WhiB family redox-sensing transcriptional regulator